MFKRGIESWGSLVMRRSQTMCMTMMAATTEVTALRETASSPPLSPGVGPTAGVKGVGPLVPHQALISVF